MRSSQEGMDSGHCLADIEDHPRELLGAHHRGRGGAAGPCGSEAIGSDGWGIMASEACGADGCGAEGLGTSGAEGLGMNGAEEVGGGDDIESEQSDTRLIGALALREVNRRL